MEILLLYANPYTLKILVIKMWDAWHTKQNISNQLNSIILSE